MPASFSQTIIMGNLGRDPVVRYSPNQTAIAELSVATSEYYTNKQTQQKEEKVEWHRVKCFGRNAEIARDFLKEGSPVQIVGKNKTRKYQDKDTGQDRFITEIEANKYGGLLLIGSNPNGQGQSQQGYKNQQPSQGQQTAPNGFNGQQPMNSGQAPQQQPQYQSQNQQMPPGGFDQQGGFER